MIYFVTGKLGSGKTLASVGRIRDYLRKGLPVATNLDLNLPELLNYKNNSARVFRLPDHPIASDMNVIGIGNESYDETKNGAIVLDECGTWFNTRSWGDKGRREMIDWMLHARKKGWDVYFIVQDFSMVDKQARSALGEHVVYCKRLDRFAIPFLSFFFRIFGFNLRPPRVHLAIVKYGESRMSPTVDRWTYRGNELYAAYDTKQVFIPRDMKSSEVFMYLTPWLVSGRYKAVKNMRFYMRLTRIYMKTFSRVLMLSAGIALGSASVAYAFYSIDNNNVSDLSAQVLALQKKIDIKKEASDDVSLPLISDTPYDFSKVSYSGSLGGSDLIHLFTYHGSTDFSFTSRDLVQHGYSVVSSSGCGVSLVRSEVSTYIGCYPSASPQEHFPTPPAQRVGSESAPSVFDSLPF